MDRPISADISTPPPLEILECTLRDGSYVINFQFTADDTRRIAGELDRVGFPLIEVGHGVGMGASERGMGVAAETDVAYMKAAADAVKRGRWGMFCIPGVAQLDDIDTASDYGMHFVRIGTNVDDCETAKPFVELAKKRGMMVCANFMKSYALPPREFAEKVAYAADLGVDVVYVVDSAGGMLTSELLTYFEAARARCTTRMGFHGHNNLGLAMANSLAAVEAGATVVDTSLQGFGRSAGNTVTELFLVLLRRAGIDLGIDPIAVMDLGEKYVVPLIEARGISSLDMVAGWAQFHTSYMTIIGEFATRYRVDPRDLILAVTERDRISAPRDLVEKMASGLASANARPRSPMILRDIKRYYGNEQR